MGRSNASPPGQRCIGARYDQVEHLSVRPGVPPPCSESIIKLCAERPDDREKSDDR